LLEKAAAQLQVTLVYKAIEGSADGLSKGGLIEIEETLDTPAGFVAKFEQSENESGWS
jgi:hypothetical protein